MTDDLAERQARDTAALARELIGDDYQLRNFFASLFELAPQQMHRADAAMEAVRWWYTSRPCTWGDDAWHRAVSRLTRLDGSYHFDFRRLLAEERAKTGGEQL